ncbi:hypothetical protein C4K68_25300 [Pokkaliibacter plantistimulans]|uniref:Transport permease protein n=1 Tax=Proteobacteria bacterium 228 TaxID=2083153 RepID=A0A2S5KJ44_9PROT|nr:ABC transporter permease [Pokkaliibacter plantistimulans]PPC74633.1 hypothetical protein C4K68_25300 [Pokkaliibacter plantistimulans]
MTILKRRASIKILSDVVFAIFIRELKGRFGTYRLGIGWAIIDPLVLIIMMSSFRAAMGAKGVQGIPFPVFYMLGYIPFLFFMKTQAQVGSAVKASQGLFGYRQVKPIDAIIARTLLEILILIFVFALLYGAFFWLGINIRLDNPLELIASIFFLSILGLGVGICICIIQSRFPESEKIIDIAMRPLFFISGVMFSLDEIPQQYREYLEWNPVLHGTELARDAAYDSFNTVGGSMPYLAFWSLFFLFLGLAIYRLEWKRIIAS